MADICRLLELLLITHHYNTFQLNTLHTKLCRQLHDKLQSFANIIWFSKKEEYFYCRWLLEMHGLWLQEAGIVINVACTSVSCKKTVIFPVYHYVQLWEKS